MKNKRVYAEYEVSGIIYRKSFVSMETAAFFLNFAETKFSSFTLISLKGGY